MRKTKHIRSLLAALAAVLCFSSCDTGPKYNWYETYDPESDQPYGTMIFHKLLEGYSKDEKLKKIDGPMQQKIQPADWNGSALYVFIGHELYLGEEGSDSLLSFVKKGNKAFIAAKQLPGELVSELRNIGCSYETAGEITNGENDSIVKLNFYHPQLSAIEGYDYSYYFQDRIFESRWHYFATMNLCDTADAINYLGYMGNHRVNFIRIPYGKGEFLLHATPMAFTNYYMVNKKGYEYAEKAFSHVNKGGKGSQGQITVMWDSYHGIFIPDDNVDRRETPLRFLLQQEPLKWALYITLILLLLYILFRSKRKQRVIPVLEAKENTSLEFVQTIGTLYFQQNEHRKLAIQKMKLFLQYIRNRYSIPTNNINEETLKKISVKSQVPYSNLHNIFEQYQWIESMPEINDHNLINFHQSIDNFYKTCK